MRTLEEMAVAAADGAWSVVHDLIAHVQQQAEQIATLTARVAALEASEAERAIDRMVARRTGPGRPMESAGQVQTPAKLDEAPAAPPPPAAPAPASDDEVEQLRVQLAGCGVAAMGGIGSRCQVASRGDYGWSQSYQDVVDLRIKYEKLLAETGAAPAPASDDYEHNQGGDDMRATGEKPDPVGRASGMAGTRPDDDPSFRAPAAGQAEASRKAAADDYEARAQSMLRNWEDDCYAGGMLSERIAALLRTVADEARREERAACEAMPARGGAEVHRVLSRVTEALSCDEGVDCDPVDRAQKLAVVAVAARRYLDLMTGRTSVGGLKGPAHRVLADALRETLDALGPVCADRIAARGKGE